MGGVWSSWSSPTKPVIESVRVDPSDEAAFGSPLSLHVSFATQSMSSVPTPSPAAVWTVSLEVDIAHLQARYPLLSTRPAPLERETTLLVSGSAWESLTEKHTMDALANISALHLRCCVGSNVIVEESVIVDAFIDGDCLKRRLYGCLPSVDSVLPDRDGPGYYPPPGKGKNCGREGPGLIEDER